MTALHRAGRTAPVLAAMVAGAAMMASGMVPANARAGVRFGIEAAGQFTQMPQNASGSGFIAHESRWSGTGGARLVAEWPLPWQLALASGLGYDELAQVDHFHGNLVILPAGTTLPFLQDWRTRVRALTLPVAIRWSVGPLRLGAGAEANYVLAAYRKVEPGPVTPALVASPRRSAHPAAIIFENLRLSGDARDQFHRWNAAATGSVGVAPAWGRHEVRADLRWREGLVRFSKLNPGSRTRAATLALGMMW
jgi:hypothetical protein